MPIYDFECNNCGHIQEVITSISGSEKETITCPTCNKGMVKIISMSGVHCANEDSPWIRSVLEVVDKEDPRPAHREFLKRPTRKNYKSWMREAGLRHSENNERKRPDPIDLKRLTDKTMEQVIKRERIEI